MTKTKRKILIVDDEPHVANITGRVIECEFPNELVIVTTSSEEALKIIEDGAVAVLLCDLQMPVYDGAHVLRVAFERNPRTVSVIITGHATKDSMIRAVNEGHMWRCIEKPWTADQLSRTVHEALAAYEERRGEAKAEDRPADAPAEKDRGKGPLYEEKDSAAAGGKVVRKIFIDKVVKQSPRFGAKVQRAPMPLRIAPKGGKERRSVILDSRYRNMQLIKEGGSGVIYKSFDSLLKTPVAVKILNEKLTSNKQALEELLREARIAMQLSHKHIVRLHNIEHVKRAYYLVMEYIDGSSLRDTLERVRFLAPEVVVQIVDVCEDALSYAHRRNVFHRDIKPDNIMVTTDGVLKIIDFGLACVAESFRRTGEIIGTPYYMSPEELRGEKPDQRADIYSMGIMAHELLQGNLPPHRGPGPMQTVVDYVPLASQELPEPVRKVLQKSFDKTRDERWNDMYEFASNFREACQKGYKIEVGS